MVEAHAATSPLGFSSGSCSITLSVTAHERFAPAEPPITTTLSGEAEKLEAFSRIWSCQRPELRFKTTGEVWESKKHLPTYRPLHNLLGLQEMGFQGRGDKTWRQGPLGLVQRYPELDLLLC